MATEYVDCVVWVCVDEHGEYLAHEDVDTLAERIGEEWDSCENGRRFVRLSVRVPKPTTIELAGAVTVDEAETALKVQ